MKPNNISKYIAAPSGILMTLLILLIAVLFLQGIILQTASVLTYEKHRAAKNQTDQDKDLTEEEKRFDRIRNSQKEFLHDGTIHLVHRPQRSSRHSDEPEKVQIYDANDNLLWQGFKDKIPYQYLSWSGPRPHQYHRFTHKWMKNIQMITPEFSQVLEIPITSPDKTRQIWRYHPNKDFFIGYDTAGQKIGHIGSTGFTHSKDHAKPFGKFKSFTAWTLQHSHNPILLWQTARRIYQINFEKQHVRLLFESTESDIKMAAPHMWWSFKPGTIEHEMAKNYRPTIRCLTEDGKHHLIMRNPDQTITVTPPADWWTDALQLTATKDDIFLCCRDTETRPPSRFKPYDFYLQWYRKFEGKPHKEWIELYKLDNQANLHLLNRFEWTAPPGAHPKVSAIPFRTRIQRSVAVFSTPLYDLAWYLLGREFFIKHYRDKDFFAGFARATAEIRPASSICNWLLGLAMTVFTLCHAWPRRTSWQKLTFWLVFVLAFNLAGLLTYLALNHTSLIKCPACGKRRGLTQPNCIRCGAQLPPPQPRKSDLIFN